MIQPIKNDIDSVISPLFIEDKKVIFCWNPKDQNRTSVIIEDSWYMCTLSNAIQSVEFESSTKCYKIENDR